MQGYKHATTAAAEERAPIRSLLNSPRAHVAHDIPQTRPKHTTACVPQAKARKELTLPAKLSLIHQATELHCRQADLAHEYGVSRGTVRRILTRKQTYLACASGVATNTARKRVRRAGVARGDHVSHVDAQVLAWIEQCRAQHVDVTFQLLRDKALECARELQLPHFKASTSWLKGFRQRYGAQLQQWHQQDTGPPGALTEVAINDNDAREKDGNAGADQCCDSSETDGAPASVAPDSTDVVDVARAPMAVDAIPDVRAEQDAERNRGRSGADTAVMQLAVAPTNQQATLLDDTLSHPPAKSVEELGQAVQRLEVLVQRQQDTIEKLVALVQRQAAASEALSREHRELRKSSASPVSGSAEHRRCERAASTAVVDDVADRTSSVTVVEDKAVLHRLSTYTGLSTDMANNNVISH